MVGFLIVPIMFVCTLGLFPWPVAAVGERISLKPPIKPRRFAPDTLTGIMRDRRRRLVRINIKNSQDLTRATNSGTILQNFGSFAIVSQPRASKIAGTSGIVVESTVSLPGKSFDPVISPRKETVGYNARPESGYYIVQFGGVVTDDWLNDLRSAGIEILQYVPHQAFLVYGNSDAIAMAATYSRVRWVGRYLADEKIPPVLAEQIRAVAEDRIPRAGISDLTISNDGRAVFDIAVFSRADVDAVASQICSQFSGTDPQIVRLPNNFFNLVRVELPIDNVADVANVPDVVRIDASGVRQAEDERSDQIVAGNYSSTSTVNPPGYDPLAQFGVDGSGVTVAVVDDGVNIPGNGGFYLTASNTSNGNTRGAATGATTGHGHLNASIIAGSTPFGALDPLGYNYGLGVAPKSNILNIPLLVSGYSADFTTLYDDVVTTSGVNGVRATISNNSWGSLPNNMNAYDSMAAEFDGYARDSSMAGTIDPLLLIFSAGNSGPSGLSLTRPKVAKNIIAVGNSESLRTELGGTDADNIDDLNSSSSRGPAADGRVKPDVIAPGSYITGSRAGACGSLVSCLDANHVSGIGTSFAAPHVTGAAALFTQFWRSSNVGQTPSPAMVKAAIINSAQEMNGSGTITPIPNGDEGWGRLEYEANVRTWDNLYRWDSGPL